MGLFYCAFVLMKGARAVVIDLKKTEDGGLERDRDGAEAASNGTFDARERESTTTEAFHDSGQS